MPVAVPLTTTTQTVSALTTTDSATYLTVNAIENGFTTRPLQVNETEGESSEEEEEEDDDEDFSEDTSDYSDEEEQASLLGSATVSSGSSGLFEEYFDFEPSVISRSRNCDHTVTSRPCPFCAPSVSLRLANEVRIAFKALFSSRSTKIFGYLPLDSSVVSGAFKAVKALHDLAYIKKVLDEIINLVVSVQNSPDCKVNYLFNSAVLRMHDRTDSLLDDVRGTDKYEEFKLLSDFKHKLNSIGMVQGTYKENYNNLSQTFIECQR
jgi:hypothetical protein